MFEERLGKMFNNIIYDNQKARQLKNNLFNILDTLEQCKTENELVNDPMLKEDLIKLKSLAYRVRGLLSIYIEVNNITRNIKNNNKNNTQNVQENNDEDYDELDDSLDIITSHSPIPPPPIIDVNSIDENDISKDLVEIKTRADFNMISDIFKNGSIINEIKNKDQFKDRFLYNNNKIYNTDYRYVYCENSFRYEVNDNYLMLSKFDNKFMRWCRIFVHSIDFNYNNISVKFVPINEITEFTTVLDSDASIDNIKFLSEVDKVYMYLNKYYVADNNYLYVIKDNNLVKAFCKKALQKWEKLE